VDSSNTVIVSVMVEEKGRQTADKKEGRKPWTLREFGGQTVWDWLHLLSALAIPVVLAAAGLWFTAQQDQRQQEIEGQRAKQAQKIEDQRAKAERELADQRAQDEALQAYLTQMSTLLLEKDLRESKDDSEVRILARARTLTALKRLDSERNSDVLQFLREAQLISGTDPVISLNHSKLRGANLSGVDLSDADLRGAFLRFADLSYAYLSGANLHGANLSQADLQKASLGNVNLSGAFLDKANLQEAWLNRADLTNASLREANLQNVYALQDLELRRADLTNANLSEAYLNGAKGFTNEQLRAATSLEGATMPDG
jgi:uncharacterized protein YjbI with pentapeptide repeats